MSRIIVLGAGVVGLSTAMMLKARGHDVTVFERDPEPLPASPDEAWFAWERQGVTQFRQAHFLHAAGHHAIDCHLPDVKEALTDAGCVRFDLCTLMPPFIQDREPREGDDRFVTITGRRTTIEYAVASAANRRLPIVRGVAVKGFLKGSSVAPDIPHVTGVRTAEGEELTADLVIDATGRRSQLPDWLEAIGARRPIEEAEESGFIYYTRFFRSATGSVPSFRTGLLSHFHSFSLLTLPGDSHTWSITVFIFSGDPALKALRDSRRWEAVVGACPLHAHWLDGEPISDVLPMGGVSDRYRRFVVEGAPVATGILTVGDSWACTNPVGGRGISMGLMHGIGTVEVIQQHADDPLELAVQHDAMTETRVTPWYRDTVAFDRKRTAQINAQIHGRTLPPPVDPIDVFPSAMMHDAELFRAFIEVMSLLALPQEVLGRPGIAERIMEIAATREAISLPCPSRDELLRLVA